MSCIPFPSITCPTAVLANENQICQEELDRLAVTDSNRFCVCRAFAGIGIQVPDVPYDIFDLIWLGRLLGSRIAITDRLSKINLLPKRVSHKAKQPEWFSQALGAPTQTTRGLAYLLHVNEHLTHCFEVVERPAVADYPARFSFSVETLRQCLLQGDWSDEAPPIMQRELNWAPVRPCFVGDDAATAANSKPTHREHYGPVYRGGGNRKPRSRSAKTPGSQAKVSCVGPSQFGGLPSAPIHCVAKAFFRHGVCVLDQIYDYVRLIQLSIRLQSNLHMVTGGNIYELTTSQRYTREVVLFCPSLSHCEDIMLVGDWSDLVNHRPHKPSFFHTYLRINTRPNYFNEALGADVRRSYPTGKFEPEELMNITLAAGALIGLGGEVFKGLGGLGGLLHHKKKPTISTARDLIKNVPLPRPDALAMPKIQALEKLKPGDTSVYNKANQPVVRRVGQEIATQIAERERIDVGPRSIIQFNASGVITKDGGKLTIEGGNLTYQLSRTDKLHGTPIGKTRRSKRNKVRTVKCILDTASPISLYHDPAAVPNGTINYVCGGTKHVENRNGVLYHAGPVILGQDVLCLRDICEFERSGVPGVFDTAAQVSLTPLAPTHKLKAPIKVNDKLCSFVRVEAGFPDAVCAQVHRSVVACSMEVQVGEQKIIVNNKPVHLTAQVLSVDSISDPYVPTSAPHGHHMGLPCLVASTLTRGYDTVWPETDALDGPLRVIHKNGHTYVQGDGPFARVALEANGDENGFAFVGLSLAQLERVEAKLAIQGVKLTYSAPTPCAGWACAHAVVLSTDPTVFTGFEEGVPTAHMEKTLEAAMSLVPTAVAAKASLIKTLSAMLLAPMIRDRVYALPLGKNRVAALHSMVTQELTALGTSSKYFGLMSFPNLQGQLAVLSARNPAIYSLFCMLPDSDGLSLTAGFRNKAFPTYTILRRFTATTTAFTQQVPMISCFSVDDASFKGFSTLRNGSAKVLSFSGAPVGFAPKTASNSNLALSLEVGDTLIVNGNGNLSGAVGSSLVVTTNLLTVSAVGAVTVTSTSSTFVCAATPTPWQIVHFLVAPAGSVGLAGVTFSFSTLVSPVTTTISELSGQLSCAASTFNNALPFSDYAMITSPLQVTISQNNQSSGTYVATANALFVSNTSPAAYVAGNSVTGILPPGDPGEYCGFDPSILEQFYASRSSPFQTGAYMAANQLRAAVADQQTLVSTPPAFDSETCCFFAELPLPAQGGYSVRAQCGMVVELTTEQQVFKPESTPYDQTILDVLSHLFAPEPFVTSNPSHRLRINHTTQQALASFLANHITPETHASIAAFKEKLDKSKGIKRKTRKSKAEKEKAKAFESYEDDATEDEEE